MPDASSWTPGVPQGVSSHIADQVAGQMQRWTPNQRKDMQAVREVHDTMRAMPWQKASLVSLHLWPLHAQGYLHHDLRINAAPVTTDDRLPKLETKNGRKLSFVQHVFPSYIVATKPTESGDQTAYPIMPLDFALDFIRQHQSGQRDEGGLFCYVGTQTPFENWDAAAYIPQQTVTNSADLTSITVREALEQAHSRQLEFYLRMFSQAQDSHSASDKRERRNISANQRKIAQVLRAWGVIQQDPPWLVVQKIDGAPPRECPVCGKEASSPKALLCRNGSCTHIFEPFQAYQDGHIDLDTPGATLALRRLTKDQLKELGLYPVVKPRAEHIEDLKAKEHKDTKAKN